MSQLGRRRFINTSASALGAMALHSALGNMEAFAGAPKPNFVILFADDMGYGDWNRGGHPTIRTPNLNRMADEGVQITQFYSANPVCSPSRAALLTGRNPIRTGVTDVFFPPNQRGLPLPEITLAEALKPLGYRTACIGKWHLGHIKEYLPMEQGFDYYYGILYSNDMEHPDLFRNDERIEAPAEQSTLTRRYTQEAIRFIERSSRHPFLLYLPYTMPHVPIHASEDFRNTSRRGLYGDVIEEIDWSVGQILKTLDQRNLSHNTLVLFSSDNGPWMHQKLEGGSSGLLRGAKGDTWEGGMREPFIARWKGCLPKGVVSTAVASTLDIFPTCVRLAGGRLPENRPMDGMDIMPVLEGRSSPERTIYYYRDQNLNAVRKGKWKLHLSYCENNFEDFDAAGIKQKWVAPEQPLLFDLEADPSEHYNLSGKYPEVVDELKQVAESYRQEIAERGENEDLLSWFQEVWSKGPAKVK